MNTNNDYVPSGIHHHAEQSWQSKYEYMNRLWLKQKDEITILHEEKQKICMELARAKAELTKKDTEIATLQTDKYKLYMEIYG
jgi:hypothetical protein